MWRDLSEEIVEPTEEVVIGVVKDLRERILEERLGPESVTKSNDERAIEFTIRSKESSYDIHADLRMRLEHLDRTSGMDAPAKILEGGEIHAVSRAAISLLDSLAKSENFDSDALYIVCSEATVRWSQMARNLLGLEMEGTPWTAPPGVIQRGISLEDRAKVGWAFRRSDNKDRAKCLYFTCDRQRDLLKMGSGYYWCGNHWREDDYLDGIPADFPCDFPADGSKKYRCGQNAVGKWLMAWRCPEHLPNEPNPKEPTGQALTLLFEGYPYHKSRCLQPGCNYFEEEVGAGRCRSHR